MAVRHLWFVWCVFGHKLSCTRLQNYTIGAFLMSVSVSLSVSVPWNSSFEKYRLVTDRRTDRCFALSVMDAGSVKIHQQTTFWTALRRSFIMSPLFVNFCLLLVGASLPVLSLLLSSCHSIIQMSAPRNAFAICSSTKRHIIIHGKNFLVYNNV